MFAEFKHAPTTSDADQAQCLMICAFLDAGDCDGSSLAGRWQKLNGFKARERKRSRLTTALRKWPARARNVEDDRAARLAAIPAGESPANRRVQSLL